MHASQVIAVRDAKGFWNGALFENNEELIPFRELEEWLKQNGWQHFISRSGLQRAAKDGLQNVVTKELVFLEACQPRKKTLTSIPAFLRFWERVANIRLNPKLLSLDEAVQQTTAEAIADLEASGA